MGDPPTGNARRLVRCMDGVMHLRHWHDVHLLHSLHWDDHNAGLLSHLEKVGLTCALIKILLNFRKGNAL